MVSLEKHRRRSGRTGCNEDRLRRPPRRPARKRRSFRFRNVSGLLALGAAMLLAAWQQGAPALASLAPAAVLGGASGETVARRFPICGGGARTNCVVDGDTLWIAGEKIRIADINTPETASPNCASEARLGARAKARLHALVNQGPFELRRDGRDADRHGRKLRVLVRDGRSLGQRLVAEGLAEPWTGRRRDWCA